MATQHKAGAAGQAAAFAADALSPTSAHSAPDLPERELHIEIERDHWFQCIGTAAQLQAEGLIPHDFEWPQAATTKIWQANGFEYWLHRTRPEGHKGPMRSWLALDNWFVRVRVASRDHDWLTRKALDRKAEDLKAEYHRISEAGSREWRAGWERFRAAQKDPGFQHFKTLIPALAPTKRTRRTKAETQGVDDQAPGKAAGAGELIQPSQWCAPEASAAPGSLTGEGNAHPKESRT